MHLLRSFSLPGNPTEKFLKTLLAVLLLTSLTLASVSPAAARQPAKGPEDPLELGAFLDGVMAAEMSTNHVPGAVVVVVKDGAVLFAKGYGYADLEARTPVDPATTLFRPGSVSKLFTWTAVMQLVEQGKLDLNADVNTYLDFVIPATYPAPVTLAHLLTHTPGFEDQGDGLFVLETEALISLETYLKERVPARVFPPGTIGAYSNYGTALAGYIVERVSGVPFYEYVEQHIFAPLGMTQATFRQPLPAALAGDMSGGYNYANGGYVQGAFELVTGYPAGALSASGLEMAKFMIAHLQNGRYGDQRILQEATAIQMHSQLFTHDPRLTGMAHGFFENVINGQRVISHGGDTILFHTGLFLLPEHNLGLFISTNAAGGAVVGEAVARAFMERYFPLASQPELTAAADFAERIPLYTGEYYLSRSNFTTLEKIMQLMNPVMVSVDADNNVLISIYGETTQFIEVEPGLLVNRNFPDDMIVMREVDGQVGLYPSSPFVFLKTPWYATMTLHLLILFGGALLFLITSLVWGTGWLRNRKQRAAEPLSARLARWCAVLFGLAYLAFLVSFGVLMGDVNPAYGVPNFFFGIPGWLGTALLLPGLAGLLALGTVGFSLVAWRQRLWTVSGRVYYTFLALAALAITWALVYWNFLF